MKYIVKLYIEGAFPGSPDHDYYLVGEHAFDRIKEIIGRYPHFDTLEDARKGVLR